MTCIKQHFWFPVIMILGLGLAVIGAGTALAETADAEVKATDEVNQPGPLIGPRAEL